MKLTNLSPPPGQAGHPSRVDPTTLQPPHTDEYLLIAPQTDNPEGGDQ